ncbi:Alpha/Beta hydrolase protein [Pterulicium gracile]|uniref:Carboxylic ester hydrolase n=1 Tax=Pterulicium gracile TaxID=1884261 RepID=A0A5C3QI67_9AGAR|nr:Alpha/Beta hydrolase protein [Pterula gracilis]
MAAPTHPSPQLVHSSLRTTFTGVIHPKSTPDCSIHQYRGIKYASIPARFRQSVLFNSYPEGTDVTRFGPICPQRPANKTVEDELFGTPADDTVPFCKMQQDEFECLNMNITCPAGVPTTPLLPVMVWIHGGGERGSGSSWAYDGGAIVKKSAELGKPIILVTINYRIGLFGFAASPALRDDNEAAGDVGVGNYGLHDQRQALTWIRNYIGEFGGAASSVTIFGSSTGASDVVSHLLSSRNSTTPLFHRAIVQSPVIDPSPPNVYAAGSMMSRLLCRINSSLSGDIDTLRKVNPDDLVNLSWQTRVTDDGAWFKDGWKTWFEDEGYTNGNRRRSRSRASQRSGSGSARPRSKSRSRASSRPPSDQQPMIIGDSSPSFAPEYLPAEVSLMSMWTAPLLNRRLKAVCQSLAKASRILRAYELDSSQISAEDEEEEIFKIEERVRQLVHDARVGWPTDRAAEAAVRDRGGRGVWRYVFDEEGVEDVRCFFDCAKVSAISLGLSGSYGQKMYESDEMGGTYSEEEVSSSSSEDSFDDGMDDNDSAFGSYDDDVWGTSSYTCASPYQLVRDALQSRWISFSYGESPWNEHGVYVFGPEGETGERSTRIFEGRRRKDLWSETLAPLGMTTVWKVGVELERGPTGVGMGVAVVGNMKV